MERQETMKKFFIMSAGIGLMLLGTFGFSVSSPTSTGGALALVQTAQIPVAKPSSSSNVDVCAKSQPFVTRTATWCFSPVRR